MSNSGKNMLNEMEFSKRLKEMGDRELSEFTARQAYETRIIVETNVYRIGKLENRDRRTSGLIGGAGVFFGGAVVAVVEFFRKST